MQKIYGIGIRFLLILLLGFVISILFAQAAPACPDGMVWVPKHTLKDGSVLPGYCRPMEKPGTVWVPGHYGKNGRWIRGDWKPAVKAPKGKGWVPGHIDRFGKWVPGHWRKRK